MKKGLFIISTVVFLLAAGTCPAQQAPHRVGVFTLNRNIAEAKDYVIMETALPIRHLENIEEVEIRPIEGLKSGLIAYATCAAPGHIVRIKLKYADASKKFFENLFKRVKKKFGEPDEYRGDPFHIFISWKWSFVDKDGNRISMTLQHNSQAQEEKIGNAVKLTMTNLIEEDQRCYKIKALDKREKLRQRQWKVLRPPQTGWDFFVPQ
jgi:hypothetical protein